MPRIVKTTVYELKELSEAAKERARAWYRDVLFRPLCLVRVRLRGLRDRLRTARRDAAHEPGVAHGRRHPPSSGNYFPWVLEPGRRRLLCEAWVYAKSPVDDPVLKEIATDSTPHNSEGRVLYDRSGTCLSVSIAISASGALKRPRRNSSGITASTASSFLLASILRYLSVVRVSAWPSHSATLRISPVASSMTTAQLCRS